MGTSQDAALNSVFSTESGLVRSGGSGATSSSSKDLSGGGKSSGVNSSLLSAISFESGRKPTKTAAMDGSRSMSSSSKDLNGVGKGVRSRKVK